MILTKAHEGVVGGHYAGNVTTQNIFHVTILWPTLHKDVKELCKNFDVCYRIGKPSRRDEIPLLPQVTLHAFDKGEVDFMGLINPPVKKSREIC
jgi:hypothetical protein